MPTLSELTGLFDRLNSDEQLLLLDCLAERTAVHELIGEGLDTAAHAINCEELFPAAQCSPATYARFARQRNQTVERAIKSRGEGLYPDEPEARPAHFTLGRAAA